jgi:hypothetical protein
MAVAKMDINKMRMNRFIEFPQAKRNFGKQPQKKGDSKCDISNQRYLITEHILRFRSVKFYPKYISQFWG